MSKSRKPWLDIIRATAILCVVLCHSVEAFYRPVLLGQLRLSFPFWNIENLLFTVGRIGVPLFLATTGALMLPRCPGIIRMFLLFTKNHCFHYSLLQRYGSFSITFFTV